MSKQDPARNTAPLEEPKPPFPAQRQSPPGLESQMEPPPHWRGTRYRPAGKLQGMVALVTGGDSGIGRSIAYHFAREGADVGITCLPEEGADAEATRRAIENVGQRCEVFPCDLTQARACADLVKRTLDAFGRLNVLVHNAAWQNRKGIEDLSEDELDRTLKTNVYAFLRLARAAVPHLPPGSSILSTGSVVGLQGAKHLADYGATKGAIHAITKCLADELRPKQIRVNCVAPGPVWTPLNVADTGVSPEQVSTFGQDLGKSPMGRPAQPEELAPAFVFLASNADSSYVNGIVLPVTGGEG